MSLRIPRTTKQFRRDYARIRRSGKKIAKLDEIMKLLIRGVLLPVKCKDHALQGKFRTMRDCHVEGDWVLLYQLGFDDSGQETITFHATDNHENLFG